MPSSHVVLDQVDGAVDDEQVAGRGEAAAVAHRLGLDKP
jgi:hypothetical protein